MTSHTRLISYTSARPLVYIEPSKWLYCLVGSKCTVYSSNIGRLKLRPDVVLTLRSATTFRFIII